MCDIELDIHGVGDGGESRFIFPQRGRRSDTIMRGPRADECGTLWDINKTSGGHIHEYGAEGCAGIETSIEVQESDICEIQVHCQNSLVFSHQYADFRVFCCD